MSLLFSLKRRKKKNCCHDCIGQLQGVLWSPVWIHIFRFILWRKKQWFWYTSFIASTWDSNVHLQEMMCPSGWWDRLFEPRNRDDTDDRCSCLYQNLINQANTTSCCFCRANHLKLVHHSQALWSSSRYITHHSAAGESSAFSFAFKGCR